MTGRFPVVLLHGWQGTEKHWRYLIPGLEQSGFEPTPLTLPGLGVEADEHQSFCKTASAKWVRAQVAELGITKFALVGHDWDATVAVLLAKELGSGVTALVVEEEVLPGIDVEIPLPGSNFYPTWHGSFNRAVNLAERLVSGRESAFYGTFLTQDAAPDGLDEGMIDSYIHAYSTANILHSGLGYYRTRADDVNAVQELLNAPLEDVPVLALGGRYAMGSAVIESMRTLAVQLIGLVFDSAGRYPVEQEPEAVSHAILEFLERNQHTS